MFSSIVFRASAGIAARVGVSTIPGDTTLKRIGAISRASPWARVSRAALMAPTSAIPGLGRRLRKPERNTNDPSEVIFAFFTTRYAPRI